MKKYIYFWIFIWGVLACDNTSIIEESMYFWRTNLEFSEEEQSFLKAHNIQKLYVRYCDIGLKERQAVPIAPIDIDTAYIRHKTIIPVVYIKNEVFKDIEKNPVEKERLLSSEQLSERIAKYIKQINRYYSLRVNEVQFDCDWTLGTRASYFAFLKHFKEGNPEFKLSATIRLHQIKYKDDTGVPPVDYGVLMYYNMNAVNATGVNSIYDRETGKRYINRLKDYPLFLNIALPMFSWGVHSVNGQVVNLVSGLTSAEIKQLEGVEATNLLNVYEVKRQTYYKGRLWQAGDRIKIEEVSDTDRKEMTQDLLKNMKTTPKEVIWFR